MSALIEGKDFYYNEDGYMVFTEKYHLKKGFCCGNGCRHCPYKASPNPSKGEALDPAEMKNIFKYEKTENK